MKKKKLDLRLLFALLFLFCLGFLSTQNTLNGHGILTSKNLDAQVWAQTGTTNTGGSGGSTPGGTPNGGGYGACVEYEYSVQVEGSIYYSVFFGCEGTNGGCNEGKATAKKGKIKGNGEWDWEYLEGHSFIQWKDCGC